MARFSASVNTASVVDSAAGVLLHEDGVVGLRHQLSERWGGIGHFISHEAPGTVHEDESDVGLHGAVCEKAASDSCGDAAHANGTI